MSSEWLEYIDVAVDGFDGGRSTSWESVEYVDDTFDAFDAYDDGRSTGLENRE